MVSITFSMLELYTTRMMDNMYNLTKFHSAKHINYNSLNLPVHFFMIAYTRQMSYRGIALEPGILPVANS